MTTTQKNPNLVTDAQLDTLAGGLGGQEGEPVVIEREPSVHGFPCDVQGASAPARVFNVSMYDH
jgi:hypothetical protein